MAIGRRRSIDRQEIAVWRTQNDRTTGYGLYGYRLLKCGTAVWLAELPGSNECWWFCLVFDIDVCVDETKFGAEPRHLIRSASYAVKTSTAIKYTVSLPGPGPVTHMSNGRLPRNRPYPNRGTRSTVWSPPRLDTLTHLTICRPQYVLIRLSVSIPGNKR